MMSPPRELTRTMPVSPQKNRITDITSDENGRDVVGRIQNPSDGSHQLNDEVAEMTQRHLTSEFELAVFSNRVTEAEVRERNLEYELSQEIHLFNQARQIIVEMRETFSIEDGGCSRRIGMLENERDECAAELIELGNRAEMILQERSEEHDTELQSVKNRAEAYIGYQGHNITKLRHELNQANEQLQTSMLGREQISLHGEEVERLNGVLSNELLMAKANSQHHEAELSLMKSTLNDRTAVFNSELMNLLSTIHDQNAQNANRSNYTDEEIRSYLSRKLAMIRDEYHQESTTHQAMIQSEGDVARLYKGRYEHMAQSATGKDPSTDQIVQSLRSRLDHEANHAHTYREKHDKVYMELNEMRMKLKTEEYEMKQNSKVHDRTRKKLEEEEQIRARLDRINYQSKNEMEQRDKRIEFLESENDRLRDDRNEHKAYSQELFEQLWESEEYGLMKQARRHMQKQPNQAKEKPASQSLVFPEANQTKSWCHLGPNHTTSMAGRGN